MIKTSNFVLFVTFVVNIFFAKYLLDGVVQRCQWMLAISRVCQRTQR